VSKKSYEQMNCIFFTKDCVKHLAKEFNFPDGTIAFHLKTRGSKRYRMVSQGLVHYGIMNKSYLNVYPYVSDLLRQGADINFHSLKFGTTPLIKAVEKNNLQLVSYFIQKGACVDDCNNNQKSVRSFNLLYNYEQLEKIIIRLNEEKIRVEVHNAQAKKYRGRCFSCVDTYDCLSVLPESRQIYRALCIDKLCEYHGSPAVCCDNDHPLIQILQSHRVTGRTIRAIFKNNKLMIKCSIAKNILRYLQ
jgi:hypothetical protein